VGEGPQEGTIKWYDSEKGYGFITHPGGSEFFFHRNSVAAVSAGLVQDGVRVTYRVEKSPKGPQAVDVTLVE
jgi:CspA family cold shock protein